jgi:hypothetical protein
MSFIKGDKMKKFVITLMVFFMLGGVTAYGYDMICTEKDKLRVELYTGTEYSVKYCCLKYTLKEDGILKCKTSTTWDSGWRKLDATFYPPYTIIPMDE